MYTKYYIGIANNVRTLAVVVHSPTSRGCWPSYDIQIIRKKCASGRKYRNRDNSRRVIKRLYWYLHWPLGNITLQLVRIVSDADIIPFKRCFVTKYLAITLRVYNIYINTKLPNKHTIFRVVYVRQDSTWFHFFEPMAYNLYNFFNNQPIQWYKKKCIVVYNNNENRVIN